MPDWTREYDEAVERQNLIRDLAFAGDSERPLPENIAGFEVMPMTMRHFVNLRLINSPFICGGKPTQYDAIAFLWQLNPEYSINNRRGKAIFVDRCERTFVFPTEPVVHLPFLMARWAKVALVRLQRFGEVLMGISQYLEEALLDAPGGSGESRRPAYFSDAAGYCDRFSKEYRWPVEYSMNAPFKLTFQLMKLIDARQRVENKLQPMFFNKLSDGVTSRMLEEDNRRMRN